MSVYGCTRQSDFPSDANSLIPGDDPTYNADTLGLGKLPDPYLTPEQNGGDEVPPCVEDGDYVGDLPGEDEDLGGGDIKGMFCACTDDECNSATSVQLTAASVLAGLIAAVAL